MSVGSLTQWQRIVFDPLSWIESSRVKLPAHFNQKLCRSVFNQVIISELRLVTDKDYSLTDRLTGLFIDEWFSLKQAGMLLACQRHRANLACSGRLQTFPESVRQFARLPLLNSHFRQGESLLDDNDLEQQALLELHAFCPRLPESLRQRVPLLFAKFTESSGNEGPSFAADSGLLILAIQHAKRNPW